MLTDELWGGTLDEINLDVSKQTLTLIINITHERVIDRHELLLLNIHEFRFFSSIESPWDYVEITELHFEKDRSTQQWFFELMFWSEDAGLAGKCGSVVVDGHGLEL